MHQHYSLLFMFPYNYYNEMTVNLHLKFSETVFIVWEDWNPVHGTFAQKNHGVIILNEISEKLFQMILKFY